VGAAIRAGARTWRAVEGCQERGSCDLAESIDYDVRTTFVGVT
jgi:hypothetical protein